MAYVLSFRGFNEVTSQNGNWYQSWSGSTPTVNSGSSGLQNFGVFFDQNLVGHLTYTLTLDKVVTAARDNNVHLIVALYVIQISFSSTSAYM